MRAITVSLLVVCLLLLAVAAFAQDQPAGGGGGGGRGGGGGGFRGMGGGMGMMAPPAIITFQDYLFVVVGGWIYKVDPKEVKVVGMAQLTPPPTVITAPPAQ